MSDDNLVKRLRRYSYQQGTGDEQGKLIAELVADMHQAADRIEELQKGCDNLHEYIAEKDKVIEKQAAEIERLSAEVRRATAPQSSQ